MRQLHFLQQLNDDSGCCKVIIIDEITESLELEIHFRSISDTALFVDPEVAAQFNPSLSLLLKFHV